MSDDFTNNEPEIPGQQSFELYDDGTPTMSLAAPMGPHPESYYAQPRHSHRRMFIAGGTAVVTALALTGWGVSSAVGGSAAASGFPATSALSASTSLTAASVAKTVDNAVVDVISKNKYTGEEDEGTGMIITSSGDVLTNNHVVEDGTSLTVRLVSNGATYDATVVGTDATDDVALIKIKGVSGLPTISVGDTTSVKVGTAVAAIGNALGKNSTPTVTTGTITGTGKSITASDGDGTAGEQLTGLLETNADIVSGDSGGPLVDSSGQVIAMDTAAEASSSGGGFGFGSTTITSSTQGYAIPITTALAIAKKIASGEASTKIVIGTPGFLGVEVASDATSQTYGGGQGFGGGNGFGNNGYGNNGYGYQGDGTSTSTSTSGATVAGVISGTPAANAGITQGDVITKVNGTTVTSADSLKTLLSSTHSGDRESVTWTDASGTSHTATMTLVAGPAA